MFLILLFSGTFFAQKQNYTISGIVNDANSGEALIGAEIKVNQIKGIGTYGNEYGFYSLTIKQGIYNLIVSYIGFVTDTALIVLTSNVKNDFSLEDGSIQLEEITVTNSSTNNWINKPISGIGMATNQINSG